MNSDVAENDFTYTERHLEWIDINGRCVKQLKKILKEHDLRKVPLRKRYKRDGLTVKYSKHFYFPSELEVVFDPKLEDRKRKTTIKLDVNGSECDKIEKLAYDINTLVNHLHDKRTRGFSYNFIEYGHRSDGMCYTRYNDTRYIMAR